MAGCPFKYSYAMSKEWMLPWYYASSYYIAEVELMNLEIKKEVPI